MRRVSQFIEGYYFVHPHFPSNHIRTQLVEKKKMYTLTTTDEHRSPSDVWVLDLTRTPSGALAAISSDQKLSIFDPKSLSRGPQGGFTTSHGNLTTLKVFGESAVCTAGENGTVEVWDLRSASKAAQFEGEWSSSLKCQKLEIGSE